MQYALIFLFTLGLACSTNPPEEPQGEKYQLGPSTSPATKTTIFARKTRKFQELHRAMTLNPSSTVLPAKQYLLSHTGELGIAANDLQGVDTSSSPRHTRYEQYFGGYPIYSSTYNIHLDEHNSLISIDGILFEGITPANNDGLGFNDVEELIAQDLALAKDDLLFDCNKYVFPYQQQLLYAMHCRVVHHSEDRVSRTVWGYWVNLATTADRFPRFLSIKDEARSQKGEFKLQLTNPGVTVQGMVFTFNPMDGPIGVVDFQHLLPENGTSVSSLNGIYVRVLNDDIRVAEPKLTSGSFVDQSYGEASPEVDMLMIYHYLDQGKTFFHEQGFDDGDTQVIAYANVSNLGEEAVFDNAAYMGKFPLPNGLGPRYAFMFSNGKHFQDPALSADVILHELTHYVVDRVTQIPQIIDDPTQGPLENKEGSGLHEGFADFFAATYTDDPFIGEYYCGKGNCLYEDGDADDANNKKISYLRNLAGTDRVYSTTLTEGLQEVHIMGEMWGQALWQLRGQFVGDFPDNTVIPGGGSGLATRLVLGSLQYLNKSTLSMLEGYQAILLADEEQHGGKYHVPIIAHLTQRGFQVPGGVPSDNSIPVAVAEPQNGVRIELSGAANGLDLTGSNSYDFVEGVRQQVIGYYWKLTSKPETSTYRIADPYQASLRFTPDAPGSYVFDLLVADNFVLSRPSRVVVEATSNGSLPNSEQNLPPASSYLPPNPAFLDMQPPPYNPTGSGAYNVSPQHGEYQGDDILVTSAGGCLLTGNPTASQPRRDPSWPLITLLVLVGWRLHRRLRAR